MMGFEPATPKVFKENVTKSGFGFLICDWCVYSVLVCFDNVLVLLL